MLRLEVRLDGSEHVYATLQPQGIVVAKDAPFPVPDFAACRVLSEYVSTAELALEVGCEWVAD